MQSDAISQVLVIFGGHYLFIRLCCLTKLSPVDKISSLVANAVEEASPQLLFGGGPVHRHHHRLVPPRRRRRRLGPRRPALLAEAAEAARLLAAPHHVADVAVAGLDATPRKFQGARGRSDRS